MKQMIQKWMTSYQNHLSAFLFIQPFELLITFTNDYQEMKIKFKNGSIELCENDSNSIPNVTIKGNEEEIRKLLTGEKMLRNLVHNRELTVQASLRVILLLETLFYLGHSYFVSEISKNDLTMAKSV